jgi:hypothetical protein
MILKIFFGKKFGEKLAFFAQIIAVFCINFIVTLVFQKIKTLFRQFFSPKIVESGQKL